MQDKYDIFKELDFEDLEKLEEKLNEVLEDNVINYQLPVRKCEKCGGDLENSQVDFEGLLFSEGDQKGLTFFRDKMKTVLGIMEFFEGKISLTEILNMPLSYLTMLQEAKSELKERIEK